MRNQYLLAAEAIKAWMGRTNPTPGTVLPSGKNLAVQFGFTQPIIARACLILISQGLLARKGYKLMISARSQGVSTIEGLIHIVSYDENFGQTASRILTERGINHRLVILSWGKLVEPVLRRIFAEKPAGLLLWAPNITEQTELRLLPTCPIMVCAGNLRRWSHSIIRVDINGGSELALRHLQELGHREIAHVSCGQADGDRDFAEAYRLNCLKLNLNESASRIWWAENRNTAVLREALLEGRRRNPEVTAIFCTDAPAICATETFSVPSELSVVGWDGLPEGADCRPPLTTLAIRDQEPVALWGCTNLILQIQTIQSGRPPRTTTRATLMPDLVLRKSTQALVSKKAVTEPAGEQHPTKSDPAKTWRTVYPFLQKERAPNWRQLDLSLLANHSLTRQHGWLGADPLEHFPPGLRSIHGVPFQVLDENRNQGRAVITFRSPHTHSAAKKKLPTTAKIKMKARARALYFLHGCGFAFPVAFAEYIVHLKSGSSHRVQLIPLGGSRSIALEQLGGLEPNLQDWWPDDYEQEDFPHAHHLTVYNPAEPGVYERFLYSLEWINPKPEEEIETIEVRVDPKAGPTLALIAVTALLQDDVTARSADLAQG